MRANTHFFVMITQLVLLIYCIFSLIHSYDIQNIFSVVLNIATFTHHGRLDVQHTGGARPTWVVSQERDQLLAVYISLIELPSSA